MFLWRVGHHVALEFASRGWLVFATARSTKSLSTLEEKGIEAFDLDVTKAESIGALKDEIVHRTGGKLDMLFNNAGMSTYHLALRRSHYLAAGPICSLTPTYGIFFFLASV